MKPSYVIYAILGGVVAGAAVGLIFAPAKGSDTREKISKFMRDKGITLKKKDVDKIVDELEAEADGVL